MREKERERERESERAGYLSFLTKLFNCVRAFNDDALRAFFHRCESELIIAEQFKCDSHGLSATQMRIYMKSRGGRVGARTLKSQAALKIRQDVGIIKLSFSRVRRNAKLPSQLPYTEANDTIFSHVKREMPRRILPQRDFYRKIAFPPASAARCNTASSYTRVVSRASLGNPFPSLASLAQQGGNERPSARSGRAWLARL